MTVPVGRERVRDRCCVRDRRRSYPYPAASSSGARPFCSRAAKSVGCNIAEGAALDGASKKRHYRIAKGSAVEVVAAYELASDIGETVPTDEVTRLGAAIASMLTGLIRK